MSFLLTLNASSFVVIQSFQNLWEALEKSMINNIIICRFAQHLTVYRARERHSMSCRSTLEGRTSNEEHEEHVMPWVKAILQFFRAQLTRTIGVRVGVGVKRADPPCSQKSALTFDSLKTSVIPQYPRGEWFQDPPWIPKCTHAQDPCIKWCRSMHAVSPLNPRIPNHGSKIPISVPGWLNLQMQNPGVRRPTVYYWKKSAYKRTHTVQTCVIQRSTVQRRLYIVFRYLYLFLILFYVYIIFK